MEVDAGRIHGFHICEQHCVLLRVLLRGWGKQPHSRILHIGYACSFTASLFSAMLEGFLLTCPQLLPSYQTFYLQRFQSIFCGMYISVSPESEQSVYCWVWESCTRYVIASLSKILADYHLLERGALS